MSLLVLYVPGAIVLLLVFLALYDATPCPQATQRFSYGRAIQASLKISRNTILIVEAT